MYVYGDPSRMIKADSDTREALAPLRNDPAASAVLTDIDGTLAPIVDLPQNAAVPAATSDTLRELAGRYRVVACVTGRRVLEAREMVGVAELTYIGNQGFELLEPGATEPVVDPAVRGRTEDAGRFLDELDRDRLEALGIRREDKGPIQVLHWRGARDEDEAQAELARIESVARERDLIPHWGRKILELRPVAGIDKGSSVHRLLVSEAPLHAALFAGDDRTDLDAFRALAALAGSSRLGTAVRVGVVSAESPPEIEAEADLSVPGTEGVFEILKALAG